MKESILFSPRNLKFAKNHARVKNPAKNLSYDETPDYSLCRGFFRDRMNAKGWYNDRVFDWNEIVRDDDSVKTIRLSAETLSLT